MDYEMTLLQMPIRFFPVGWGWGWGWGSYKTPRLLLQKTSANSSREATVFAHQGAADAHT